MAALLINRKGEIGIIIQGWAAHLSFIIIENLGDNRFRAQTIVREDETNARLTDVKEGSYSDDGFYALATLKEYKKTNPAGWEVFKAKYPKIAEQMEKASAEAPQ